MPHFKIAHIHEQGHDAIIVPMDSSFGILPIQERDAIILELQARSRAADLRGTVVPVWDSGNGNMAFIAPRLWHPFFESMNLQWVAANLNRELSW
jgi:hypothetical protein